MSRPSKVLVAMSGGVDSSVAAALLHERGHEVVGVTLHLWDADGEQKVGRCCAPEDREDARRTCDHLGVPHYVLDERDAFRRDVVEPFLDEYRSGRTPSPCVHCNRSVKLEMLAGLAEELGCEYVATGHYARIEHGAGGSRLFRGRDRSKDQSYFLFGLSRPTRERLLFPLGDMLKEDARREGERLGVPNANKPDSQELCFVPDGDVAAFAQRERGAGAGGDIVDETGAVLGHHGEIAAFTVGKRRGLALGGGSAPRYVLRIVPETRTVVVGGEAGLESSRLEARGGHFLRELPPEGIDAAVRIRYRHSPAPAKVVPRGDGFDVTFEQPQRAVTPGQAAVIYVGDEVVGGGFIA